MLTESHIIEIQNYGLSTEVIEQQIERFKTGFPSINILAPATLEKGIITCDEKEAQKFAKLFEKKKKKKSIVKFVPASGAATRMFKMLYSVIDAYGESQEAVDALFEKKGMHSAANFFKNLDNFAFYEKLQQVLTRNNYDIKELITAKDYKTILQYLLTEKGLNYGNLPKGLLEFHIYKDSTRTALEEHLVEGALYAKNSNKDVNIHFTVSPEHIENFKEIVNNTKHKYQEEYGVKYYVDYSTQKKTTDTIAVNIDNSPFEDKNGTIVFRPAGHGALIENLNELDYDIIFVKNIDNVVPDSHKSISTFYKKVLGGVLIHYQNEIFKYYDKVLKSKHLSDKRFKAVTSYINQELNYTFPEDFESWPRNDCKEYILEILNRPIRVCGMVKNEGEPGGGPFFVKEIDTAHSLQIIELAQIDATNQEQKEIIASATHFNPVDMVCGIKDIENKKFNLLDFVDKDTGIISLKSKDGKELKALELPGLWNGAMADWNTFFVEIPISTFNPVKEVTDLLRKEHKE